MSFNTTLWRGVFQEGNKVEWQNIVGVYMGQKGSYEFESEDDAVEFAEYAAQTDVPSLADADLKKNGIPIPVRRNDGI